MIAISQIKEDSIKLSLAKVQNLLELKETDPFWKNNDTLKFAEIITQRRKSVCIAADTTVVVEEDPRAAQRYEIVKAQEQTTDKQLKEARLFKDNYTVNTQID